MRPFATYTLGPVMDVSSQRWSGWQIAKTILLLGIPLIVGELGSIVQEKTLVLDGRLIISYRPKSVADGN